MADPSAGVRAGRVSTVGRAGHGENVRVAALTACCVAVAPL
ncbi:hypothetical protein [Nocardia sp. CA-119907]